MIGSIITILIGIALLVINIYGNIKLASSSDKRSYEDNTFLFCILMFELIVALVAIVRGISMLRFFL
jgi:hypothetical protein